MSAENDNRPNEEEQQLLTSLVYLEGVAHQFSTKEIALQIHEVTETLSKRISSK